MDFIPKDRVLETRPDTLDYIRKQYNLDKPGQMKEAINILRDWVQKQDHFKQKSFSDHYYEFSIITCKGSLERAKSHIDKICTLKTLLPQFFGNYNVKTDFGNLYDAVQTVILPELTDDHSRVKIVKLSDTPFKSSVFTNFYKYDFMVIEYLKVRDYMNSFIIIIDYTDANIRDIMSKTNPVEFRQAMSIYMDGYGIRIQAIHIITPSKLIDGFITMLKPFLSAKVSGRIHIHKTFEDIHKHVSKSLLPKEYGGEQLSMKELQNEWIEALSSEEHMKYVCEINKAVTDESCRQKNEFNEQYAGMPGTFRLLSID